MKKTMVISFIAAAMLLIPCTACHVAESHNEVWFDMWLNQQDMGIDDIFAEDVIYTESWSPQYNNRKTVKHWFQEWNTRGKVVIWEIKQFFHKGDQTIVEWYFKNSYDNSRI